MHNRFQVEKSYGLEHELAKSIERMSDNARRSHALKKQIANLRRSRQQAINLPAQLQNAEPEEEDTDEE